MLSRKIAELCGGYRKRSVCQKLADDESLKDYQEFKKQSEKADIVVLTTSEGVNK